MDLWKTSVSISGDALGVLKQSFFTKQCLKLKENTSASWDCAGNHLKHIRTLLVQGDGFDWNNLCIKKTSFNAKIVLSRIVEESYSVLQL